MTATLDIPIPQDEDVRVADLVQLGALLTEPDAVLDSLAHELARVFDVPATAISFIDHDTQHYKAAVGIPEPFSSSRVEPRDQSICSFVVGNNDMLVVEDLTTDQRFCDCAAVTDFGLRFYAGAPLRADTGRAIGSLCILDTKPRSISDRERELLRMVAEGVMSQVKLQVASRKVFEYTSRIEADLRRAVRVQRFLLPPARIEQSGWIIRHLYRPMTHLGGDFLDVIARPDGRLALLVADVTGHGTDAALTAAMIKTAFARAVSETDHVQQILSRMNAELCGAIPPGQFISAVAAILAADSDRVEIASAGHPPPIHATPAAAQPLPMHNNGLLTLDPHAPFDELAQLPLGAGERLLLYTDGAFEVSAAGDRADQLGMARLARIAHDAATAEQDAFLVGILDRLHAFAAGRFDDDVALMEIVRCPPSNGAYTI